MEVNNDVYVALFNEQKLERGEYYSVNEDTLSEIAADKGMTRQGVYDIVKRCSKELRGYEEKLSLIQKFQDTKTKVNEIQALAKEVSVSYNTTNMNKIQEISAQILDELQKGWLNGI